MFISRPTCSLYDHCKLTMLHVHYPFNDINARNSYSLVREVLMKYNCPYSLHGGSSYCHVSAQHSALCFEKAANQSSTILLILLLKTTDCCCPPTAITLSVIGIHSPFASVFGRPFVKRFALCYQTVVCLSVLSVGDVGVLWPSGWMDQDETWHAGRPRPWPHCVRLGLSSASPKGTQPPIFGPYLLWPNGWMDQDTTWYGGRPRPRPHCFMGIQLPPPKSCTAPKFFGSCLLWPNGRPCQLLLSICTC